MGFRDNGNENRKYYNGVRYLLVIWEFIVRAIGAPPSSLLMYLRNHRLKFVPQVVEQGQ